MKIKAYISLKKEHEKSFHDVVFYEKYAQCLPLHAPSLVQLCLTHVIWSEDRKMTLMQFSIPHHEVSDLILIPHVNKALFDLQSSKL